MSKVRRYFAAAITICLVITVFNLSAFAADDAAATFKAKCAMCHGPDGMGNTGVGKSLKVRDLTSADVQNQTDAELTTIISKGKNKMPEYGTKLSKEQIDSLVKYIRSLKK